MSYPRKLRKKKVVSDSDHDKVEFQAPTETGETTAPIPSMAPKMDPQPGHDADNPSLPALTHLHGLKYDVRHVSIQSGTKIQQKVSMLLSQLKLPDTRQDMHNLPVVVALHAKSSAAAKLITITEIARRETEKQGLRWWKYVHLRSHTEEMKAKAKTAKNDRTAEVPFVPPARYPGTKADAHEPAAHFSAMGPEAESDHSTDEEDEEVAFEKGARPEKAAALLEGRKKLRAVATLTIYMSRVAVPVLAALCDETTNAS